MKKYVYFLFLVILLNYNVINASEKISLISLNDIKIIFSTDAKTWNQNLLFLDKKLSMKKLQLDNNSNYSLKTTFSNGDVKYVPHDVDNRHYQQILEWVAAGNTITDSGA